MLCALIGERVGLLEVEGSDRQRVAQSLARDDFERLVKINYTLEWTQVCASHILVATEEEATNLKTQLDDGGDFAVLATEMSLDTGSGAQGGDLGCASPAGYVGPFADATMTATIGVVTDPVDATTRCRSTSRECSPGGREP